MDTRALCPNARPIWPIPGGVSHEFRLQQLSLQMRIPQLITTELRVHLKGTGLFGRYPARCIVRLKGSVRISCVRTSTSEARKRGGCGFRPSAAPLCVWIAEADRNGSDFQMALPGNSFFATQVITEPGSVTMISNSSPLVSMAKKACDVIPKGAIWTV